MSDPPAPEVEVTNTEVATNTEAHDVVMTEANMAPEANVVPDVTAPEANVAPDANLQLEANAFAPVPPPRPHTIEQAYDRGQLVIVRWPILVPLPTPVPQFSYHVEQRPQTPKPEAQAAKASQCCNYSRLFQCAQLQRAQHLLRLWKESIQESQDLL